MTKSAQTNKEIRKKKLNINKQNIDYTIIMSSSFKMMIEFLFHPIKAYFSSKIQPDEDDVFDENWRQL